MVVMVVARFVVIMVGGRRWRGGCRCCGCGCGGCGGVRDGCCVAAMVAYVGQVVAAGHAARVKWEGNKSSET